MRTLHVAALPFPTSQGTQALIHRMLEALHAQDRQVELLCYAHGAHAFEGAYTVRRAEGRVQGRSLASGPSLEKLVLDTQLARTLHERLSEFQPQVVVAHHVEAALLSLAIVRVPVVYVAHTSLETELPVYLPARLSALCRGAGRATERFLCRRASRTLAVSPLLADMLTKTSGVAVEALVLPWPVPHPIALDERKAARAALGLAHDELVLLYAGNFDAYQGLAPWLSALRSFADRAPFTWLVASESPRASFEAQLARSGLRAHVRFAPLADEPARRLIHAAADLALVPRHSAGGIPIKLFDALARGLPVIASRRACAGSDLARFCRLVGDERAEGLPEALAALAAQPAHARAQAGEAARAHLRLAHSDVAFVAALEQALAQAVPHD